MATTLKLGRRLVQAALAAAVIPTPTAGSPVRIFSWTETVRLDAALPDEAQMFFGSFPLGTRLVLRYAGQPAPVYVAPYVTAGLPMQTTSWVTLPVPAGTPMEELEWWTVDAAGVASASVFTNRATPVHIDSDRFAAGVKGVIHGYNLSFTPGLTKVYLKEVVSGAVLDGSVVDATRTRSHSVFVTYDSRVVQGKQYYPGISNGYGTGHISYLSTPITCLEDIPDTLGLGAYDVPQRAIYNRVADKVFPVTVPAGTTDITAAFNQAAQSAGSWQRANGVTGAIVEIQSSGILDGGSLNANSILVRWAANIQTTSPTGSDTAGRLSFPISCHGHTGCGLINPNHVNLSDTNTSLPFRNMSLYGNTDLLIMGGTLNLSEGAWMELDNQNGIVMVGTKVNQGIALHAQDEHGNSLQRGPFKMDGSRNVILRGITSNQAIDCISMLGCTNVSLGNNTINWSYKGNPYTGANHFIAWGGSTNRTHYSNTYNLVDGPKDMYGQKLTQVGQDKYHNYANDGEASIGEQPGSEAGHQTGSVTAATATTLTSNASLVACTGYTVAIIAGTGLFQQRTVTGISGQQLSISKAWDVLPDATSRFVTLQYCADAVTLGDEVFNGVKRGFLGYLSSMRGIRIIGCKFPNGVGADFSPFATGNTHRLMCDIYVEGNTADASTDTANGALFAMRPVLHEQPANFGVLNWNTHFRRNALSEHDPAQQVVIDFTWNDSTGALRAWDGAFNVGIKFERSNYTQPYDFQFNPAIPVSVGTVLENNSARNCWGNLRVTSGVMGILQRNLRTQNNARGTYRDDNFLFVGGRTGPDPTYYLETGTAAFTGAAVAGIGQVTS